MYEMRYLRQYCFLPSMASCRPSLDTSCSQTFEITLRAQSRTSDIVTASLGTHDGWLALSKLRHAPDSRRQTFRPESGGHRRNLSM